ncbi:hypothetical protein B0H14DRAFT_3769111 [Mycena olivaceomarginata]|nr:hypothetical protein B0H14DRAFT_3769111 [Mycena olivaceomarginata]
MVEFAQELIDEIVDQIAQTDSWVERLVIRYWKWVKAPIDLRTALDGLMSLPSLRCFGLSLCDVPASLIRHALASYQEVELEHVNLSNDDQFSALAISPPFQPTLHHLVLDDPREDNPFHSLVLSDQIAPSLANLQHLGLGVLAGGSLGDLEQLARKCSGSIQHLVINLGKQHHDPISLPDMPSLCFLTFKTSPKQLWVSYSVFSATVNLPTCMPHIEAMNIVVDAYPEHLPNDSHRPDVDGHCKISGVSARLTSRLCATPDPGCLNGSKRISGRSYHGRVTQGSLDFLLTLARQIPCHGRFRPLESTPVQYTFSYPLLTAPTKCTTLSRYTN